MTLTSLDESDMTGFGTFDYSMCERVLCLLEAGYLTLCEVDVIKSVINKINVKQIRTEFVHC